MDITQRIKDNFLESIRIKTESLDELAPLIASAANAMADSILNNHKIMACGNGGSAADAQHLATELMGGMTSHDRKPIPSIALTTDSSFITAWSNDTGFESIFSRQIQGLGKAGDVLIGISTSGNSENVLAAVKQAKFKELSTIVFTGNSGGKINGVPDISINIPSEDTQRIQEAHIMVGQILCGLIEDDLLNK